MLPQWQLSTIPIHLTCYLHFFTLNDDLIPTVLYGRYPAFIHSSVAEIQELLARVHYHIATTCINTSCAAKFGYSGRKMMRRIILAVVTVLVKLFPVFSVVQCNIGSISPLLLLGRDPVVPGHPGTVVRVVQCDFAGKDAGLVRTKTVYYSFRWRWSISCMQIAVK